MSVTIPPPVAVPPKMAGAPRLSAPPLLDVIAAELAQVEERLQTETRASDVGVTRDIAGHTLRAGGKRLRPALAILSARVVGRDYPAERAARAGAAAEMIHMATLLHDDVVDESRERRGKPTANAVFGNAITVLTGDFLLAKSISLLAHSDDNLAIVRVFSDVTIAMAEGEVLQAAVAHDLEITLATYEEIIGRKTARFLAGCCETGAMLGGATTAERAALRAYGHELGIAFQIADDLLDLAGDPQKTGKPRGTDLRDGRVTLPLLHALQTAPSDDRARLREALSAPDRTRRTSRVSLPGRPRGGFEAARASPTSGRECASRHLCAFADSRTKHA
jgi:geranylgeranyl pyrophosphate synthase